MDDGRQRILASAREIFFTRGYRRTTIRQIAAHSGLMIGSIYHYFRNKEDIFMQVLSPLFGRCDQMILARYGPETDPILRFSMVIAILLRAAASDERVCELFCEAYTSTRIAEREVIRLMQWERENILGCETALDEEAAFSRAIAVQGVLRGFLVNRSFERRMPIEQAVSASIRHTLTLCDVPPACIRETQDRVRSAQAELESFGRQLSEEGLL